MTPIPDDLTAFLSTHCDSREYRRGLAVKLALLGYEYQAISAMLDVTPGFVSQAKKAYQLHGVDGLTLKYEGRKPLLTDDERVAVVTWLKQAQQWSVEQLQQHIEQTYGVVFKSRQSYYDLLAEAGITHKRAQSTNPKRDDQQVQTKKKTSKSF